MRILYVEDNPANISLLQRVARMGGHEVLYYNEGEKALENFANDNPDLILMDLQLAGKLGGLDVVRQLRSDGVRKPIVAVTAYAMMGDKERCLEAGCDAYMSKPLPVAELVEMVNMYQEKVNAAAAEAAAAQAATPVTEPEKPAESVAPEKPVDAPVAEAKPEAEQSEQPPAEPVKELEPVAASAVAETPVAVEVKPEAVVSSEPAKPAETSLPIKPDAPSSVPVEPVTPKPIASLEPVAVPAVPVVSQNGHTTPVG